MLGADINDAFEGRRDSDGGSAEAKDGRSEKSVIDVSSQHIRLPDNAATEAYGFELAEKIDRTKQTVFYFQGDIGAGKTALIRALLRGLGVEGPIKSPTFSIMEPYRIDSFPVYHFDLYRLAHPEELEYLGWRDCFSGPSLCCVEWPEQAKGYLPIPDALFTLSPALPEGRILQCEYPDHR